MLCFAQLRGREQALQAGNAPLRAAPAQVDDTRGPQALARWVPSLGAVIWAALSPPGQVRAHGKRCRLGGLQPDKL